MNLQESQAQRDRKILLQVRNVQVRYVIKNAAPVAAVRGINLSVYPGQVLGILGESGSGKSTLASSLMQLLPANAICEGTITFDGREILRLPERELEEIRGKEIALIQQTPGLALNPVVRVGEQVRQVIRAHSALSRRQAREQALAMLHEVQLCDAERIYRAYPHQLSGGQQQRVAIAQALACRPKLVIADEPTAALDTTLQLEILQLLRELNRKFETAIILITHQPAVLAGIADRVAIMYAGRVIEEGEVRDILSHPLHPYTRALLRLMPAGKVVKRRELEAIPGMPPNPVNLPPGCEFEPRCRERMEICRRCAPETTTREGRSVSCFEYD